MQRDTLIADTPEDLEIWLKTARHFAAAHGSTARAWNILAVTLREGHYADVEITRYAQSHRDRPGGFFEAHWIDFRGSADWRPEWDEFDVAIFPNGEYDI